MIYFYIHLLCASCVPEMFLIPRSNHLVSVMVDGGDSYLNRIMKFRITGL